MPKQVDDQVTICNMALRHLGQSTGIVDFNNDASDVADGCRTFYGQVLDEVLESYPWPFATILASPPLVAGPNPPATIEYACSYRLPPDCVMLRRILPASMPVIIAITGYPMVPNLPGARVETQASRVPYRLMVDSQGILILTDFPPVASTSTTGLNGLVTATPQLPVIEYIQQQDQAGLYPAIFSQAMAFLLAFYLAPSVTGGDKFKLGDRAYKGFVVTMANAKAKAYNEEQKDQAVDAEIIQARW